MDLIVSSKLSQDIFVLERDYKYNLNLLNAKHIDINRCNKENEILREILKCKAKEIEELTSQFVNTQKTLEETEHLRTTTNKVLQDKVIYLTQDLENEKQKFKLQIDVIYNNFTKKYNQLHQFYNNLLQQRNDKYENNLKLLEKREVDSVLKAKRNANTIFEENLSLQNKIQKLDCKYITSRCFYENEFKKLRTINLNLNTDLEHSKKNHLLQQNICNKLELENNNLKREICKYDKKISNLNEQNRDGANKIFQIINDEIDKKKILTSETDKLIIMENQKLELQLNQFKKVRELPYCDIYSHKLAIDQNEILKQLVKKMRTERDELEIKNNELENRVDKIEKLVKTIKCTRM